MLPTAGSGLPDPGNVKNLAILGSTGSIGTQTLDIVRLHPDRLRVCALTAGKNVAALAEQAREFRPELVVIGDESLVPELRAALADTHCRVAFGAEGLVEAAALPGVETVVTAVVGYVGLEPTLAAVREGRRIALANKETLVVAGHLIRSEVARHGAEVIPVDSEHSAIFQCLVGEPAGSVEKLLLTASGGPFRTLDAGAFERITPADALKHPNWDMGAKITIDSATMMNKGLEVIEARWMFDIPADRLEVVVHPESIIHSMVLFSDGSTKAQLGVPDMKVPIQYALSYPERWPAPHERIDWRALERLHFEPPDTGRFPCLALAYSALELGGSAPTVLNAANEVAVARFLAEDIPFSGIPRAIEAAMQALAGPGDDIDALRAADFEARRFVEEHVRVTAH
ncbi:MAG: 1-deoxy-D-xylulose-5-phosphate reductoisomerase [Rhodothermales bacterium]|nr:1-deoxy-D-xylulose-5-phosphate reductoisomerase [Rhodothermales bacterium]MBO6779810.1 1-deoxy-D-xylulose-5-phosphate reductoisomerase [Rhodothermales bacterium]